MAQTSNPYGFKLAYGKESQLSAGNQSFRIRDQYSVQDAAYFPVNTTNKPAGIGSGDPVTFEFGAASTNHASKGTIALVSDPWGNSAENLNNATYPAIFAGGGLVGIFGGCSYQPKTQGQQLQRSGMWQNLTPTANESGALANVQDHPFLVWQVQTNGKFLASQTTAPVTPIGCNYCFTYNKGVDVLTGQSTAQLFVNNTFYTAAPYGVPQVAVANGNQYAFFKVIGLAPIPNNNWTDDFVDVLVVINDHYLKAGTYSVDPLS